MLSDPNPIPENEVFSRGEIASPLRSRGYGTISEAGSRKSLKTDTHVQVDLVWKNVTYRIPATKETPERVIIRGVSGEARSGQLCALMGSSGAGKTTLLDVLSCHLGPYEGEILINNSPLSRNVLRKVSAYVVQTEKLPESFTVRETLQFYANLKLPRSTSQAARDGVVDYLLSELMLQGARDTPIGGAFFRGISGGEKRRVSIGIELITRPGLIFLDEPTSGLDSNSSFTVMKILKKLAQGGRTIIASIHQPRPDIFYMMDVLTLLSEGENFYFGPTSRCVEYFTSIGFACPPLMNPADFIIDVMTPGADISGSTDILTVEDIRVLRRGYASSEIGTAMTHKINSASKLGSLSGFANSNDDDDRPTTLQQVRMLCWRNFVNMKRNPIEVQARIGSAIVQALLGGLVFFDQSEGIDGVRGRLSVLFYANAGIILSSVGELVQVFPQERDLVIHERRSNTYSVRAYYWSRMFTDRLVLLLLPFLFTSVLYPMVNMREGSEYFFKLYLVILLQYNAAQSLSLLIGSLVPNAAVGSVFGPLVGVLFVLFSGYLVQFSEMPEAVQWIPYLSLIRWGMQAAAINEYEGITFDDADATGCGYQSGDDVLEEYEYDSYSYAECVIFLGSVFGFLSVLLYISLVVRDRMTNKFA